MKNGSNRLFLVFSFIAVSLLWGLSFVFTKIALEELEVIEVMAVRWIIPPIVYVLLVLSGAVRLSYKGKPLKPLIALVIVQPIMYATLETWGIKLTTASESSIFIAAVPLVVILTDALILHKRPRLVTWLGVFIGFAGVLVCILFAPNASLGSKALGYLFLILTVLSGAAYSELTAIASKHFSISEISFAMTAAGGIFFNLQNLLQGNGLHAYEVLFRGGPVTWALVFMGLGCGLAAYFLYTYNLSHMDTIVVSCITTNSINIVGVVAGVLVSGDSWGAYTVIGVLLTAVGITMTALGDRKGA